VCITTRANGIGNQIANNLLYQELGRRLGSEGKHIPTRFVIVFFVLREYDMVFCGEWFSNGIKRASFLQIYICLDFFHIFDFLPIRFAI
jgi:hypothetical protein